jgi:hypothetical protein
MVRRELLTKQPTRRISNKDAKCSAEYCVESQKRYLLLFNIYG